MELTNERDLGTNERKWTISFREIVNVYPNLEEIHFMNHYRFDDGVLQRLIRQIQRKKSNHLRKVVFLYFDYRESDQYGKPTNCRAFMDPEQLTPKLKGKLKYDLNWEIKHGQCSSNGYKITVSKAQQ